MSEEPRNRILRACLKLLIPIARVLLANGIGYREFEEICRRAFVKTASQEFGVRGRETNTSRISAMTGLARKEVQKLKKLAYDQDVDSTQLLSPLADLMHVWATSNALKGPDGQPKVLSVGDVGDDTFDALVKDCMGDLPPGAVKAELVRLGAVTVGFDGGLRLARRSLIPPDADARLESAILYSMCGLADTVAHNNDPRTPEQHRRFERFVESRPLLRSEIPALRAQIKNRLTEVSEDLDVLLSAGSLCEDKEGETVRIGIGLFYTE